MTSNMPSLRSQANSEFIHPRGIYRELDRPFPELQAEAAARHACWYKSDDKPKIVNKPFFIQNAIKNLLVAASTIEQAKMSNIMPIVNNIQEGLDRINRLSSEIYMTHQRALDQYDKIRRQLYFNPTILHYIPKQSVPAKIR